MSKLDSGKSSIGLTHRRRALQHKPHQRVAPAPPWLVGQSLYPYVSQPLALGHQCEMVGVISQVRQFLSAVGSSPERASGYEPIPQEHLPSQFPGDGFAGPVEVNWEGQCSIICNQVTKRVGPRNHMLNPKCRLLIG